MKMKILSLFATAIFLAFGAQSHNNSENIAVKINEIENLSELNLDQNSQFFLSDTFKKTISETLGDTAVDVAKKYGPKVFDEAKKMAGKYGPKVYEAVKKHGPTILQDVSKLVPLLKTL
jgi:hypothetical protein